MGFYVVGKHIDSIDEDIIQNDKRVIVNDLKTLRGVLWRFNNWYWFKECTIFSYTNFYDNSTFKKLGEFTKWKIQLQ